MVLFYDEWFLSFGNFGSWQNSLIIFNSQFDLCSLWCFDSFQLPSSYWLLQDGSTVVIVCRCLVVPQEVITDVGERQPTLILVHVFFSCADLNLYSPCSATWQHLHTTTTLLPSSSSLPDECSWKLLKWHNKQVFAIWTFENQLKYEYITITCLINLFRTVLFKFAHSSCFENVAYLLLKSGVARGKNQGIAETIRVVTAVLVCFQYVPKNWQLVK